MNEKIKIFTARTIQEVQELRNFWETLNPFPLAHIDYFLTLIEFRDAIQRPHVVMLCRGETPEALAVGRIENLSKTFEIGNIIRYRSNIKTLIFDVGCFVGKFSSENSHIIIRELIKSLKNREADVAFFSEVPTNSSIYQFRKSIPGILYRDYFPDIQGHHRMTLPSSVDSFFKSRKKAKNLRRIGNRLNREFDGNVKVQCFRKEEEVDKLCRDADRISRRSYRHASGGGFVDNLGNRRCLTELAKKGALLAYILYLNDKASAFEGGVFFDNTYFADYCGYDMEYKKYEIGTYLEIKVIESLCVDPEFEYYDFGWMDTYHKNRYCDIMLEEANFKLYQPSLKGFYLNGKRMIYRVGQMGADIVAKEYLNIRRRVRDKLK